MEKLKRDVKFLWKLRVINQLDQSEALTFSDSLLFSTLQIHDMLIHIEKCWFLSEINTVSQMGQVPVAEISVK